MIEKALLLALLAFAFIAASHLAEVSPPGRAYLADMEKESANG